MQELEDLMEKSFLHALSDASTEVFEGKYKPKELKTLVNTERIVAMAHAMLEQTYTLDGEALSEWIDDYLEEQALSV